ncbi:MAG: hypothetical protein JW704_08570 [Anaerolineaceae bacterium]|nr:hypothetical protein [Anaerolineaceae bacterium]MBN2678492.1 hypothetical protein [Anaerolineaceae bacterium]
MKTDFTSLVLAIVFLVLAIVLSLGIWSEISLAPKIGLFCLGFASGISMGRYNLKGSKQ